MQSKLEVDLAATLCRTVAHPGHNTDAKATILQRCSHQLWQPTSALRNAAASGSGYQLCGEVAELNEK